MRRVHRLRSSADAILVGIGTILADDPHLTVKKEHLKNVKKIRNPLRVVLDSKGRIPSGARVLDGKAETLVVLAKKPKREIKNAEVILCGKNERIDLKRLMKVLSGKGVKKVLVEGGGEVIYSFLKEKLADELKIFVGNVVIGGRRAPTIADGEGARSIDEVINLKLKKVRKLGGGVLLEYLVLK